MALQNFLLSFFLVILATAHGVWGACSGNTFLSRSSWCNYNINTDYYSVVPNTGATREYWFTLEENTLAPDGVSRYAQTINGTMPGPTIYANWGDEVIIHVSNKLTSSTNGTSIHWHGIRQNYTNQNDGIVSITQCPTAPGDDLTYKWRATQYGTTWYHSHFSLQAWEGVFGGIVINGPASANYDVDLGVIFLNDWSHLTADELFIPDESTGPPTLDNGLINGTNTWGTGGKHFTTVFEPGISYRLRLINGALDTHFSFSIDHHTMTVIASDLVPVKPFTVDVLPIGIGQRYDVIVTANQVLTATKFWMRAVPQAACSFNNNTDNITGIVYYGLNTGKLPTTTAYNTTVTGCIDETPSLVPVVPKAVSSDFTYYENETISLTTNDAGYFRWAVNNVSMQVDWQDPTLLQIYNNDSAWTGTEGVIEIDEANDWVYVLVQSALPVPHPIHLHGHDFHVLAQGTGDYDSSVVLNNLANPPRRDTAMLLSGGYLLLAFQADNPGAWLMHCHIGFHTVEGLAIQFVEQLSKIPATLDSTTLLGTCGIWDSFQESKALVDDDSGI